MKAGHEPGAHRQAGACKDLHEDHAVKPPPTSREPQFRRRSTPYFPAASRQRIEINQHETTNHNQRRESTMPTPTPSQPPNSDIAGSPFDPITSGIAQ